MCTQEACGSSEHGWELAETPWGRAGAPWHGWRGGHSGCPEVRGLWRSHEPERAGGDPQCEWAQWLRRRQEAYKPGRALEAAMLNATSPTPGRKPGLPGMVAGIRLHSERLYCDRIHLVSNSLFQRGSVVFTLLRLTRMSPPPNKILRNLISCRFVLPPQPKFQIVLP